MFSKMTNLFYLVLVLCSCQKKLVVPDALPINAAAAASSYHAQDLAAGSLKVMTWNIAKGVGNANGAPDDEPSDYNLDSTIYIIRHSGADIVGLGEVAYEWDALTQFHNQPRLLRDGLSDLYPYSAFHITKKRPNASGRFGQMIFSKYPIDTAGTIYAAWDGVNPQGLLNAKVTVQGKTFHFFLTHFAKRPDSTTVQRNQILEMLAKVDAVGGPKVLVGDLNLWPTDQNHNLITSKFNDPLGKALTPFTYKANRYGHPRNARIDFIMGNEQAVVTNLDTIHTYASDHYPVIADVALDFSTFSMMHYTINHGANAEGTYNLAAIENEIRNSGADIISLNQVDINFSSRSHYDDQIDLLANRLGMKRSFHATIDREPDEGSNGKRRKFGQAFLSKFPIESIDDGTQLRWIYTAGATTSTPQGLFGAVININGTRTRFYVTSFSTDSATRQQQVQEAKQKMAADPLPVKILSGNLSDTPGSVTFNTLLPVFSDAFAGMGSLSFNYPSGTPAKAINYILYSGMLQTQQASVRTSQASTHRPIVTTMKLQ